MTRERISRLWALLVPRTRGRSFFVVSNPRLTCRRTRQRARSRLERCAFNGASRRTPTVRSGHRALPVADGEWSRRFAKAGVFWQDGPPVGPVAALLRGDFLCPPPTAPTQPPPMANSASAKKRIRQNVKSRARNRWRKAGYRTEIKAYDELILHGSVEDAKTSSTASTSSSTRSPRPRPCTRTPPRAEVAARARLNAKQETRLRDPVVGRTPRVRSTFAHIGSSTRTSSPAGFANASSASLTNAGSLIVTSPICAWPSPVSLDQSWKVQRWGWRRRPR